MERAEFGSGHVCSASRPDSRHSTNWQGEGGRKEEKGIRRREGEERRRRRGERYKEEEFRFSLQADVGKKRSRELRQKTRRYWAQLRAVRYRHNEVSGWRLKLYEMEVREQGRYGMVSGLHLSCWMTSVL